MERCSAVWIVAPITRAVDDKTAQSLMGQTFKLQLKFDCKYDYVTFICSKTDDILITEAIKSFAQDDDIIKARLKVNQARKDCVESGKKFQDIEEERTRTTDLRDELQDQIDHWGNQAENLDKGIAAQVYSANSRKRKAFPSRGKRFKKQRLELLDDEDEDYMSLSDDDQAATVKREDTSETTLQPKYLTAEYVRGELKRLGSEKWKARQELDNLDGLVNAAYEENRTNEAAWKRSRIELAALCIQKRNTYSKEAIQNDFARGLKESVLWWISNTVFWVLTVFTDRTKNLQFANVKNCSIPATILETMRKLPRRFLFSVCQQEPSKRQMDDWRRTERSLDFPVLKTPAFLNFKFMRRR